MRTVAVFLVVAYHCGLGLLSGGFIGVDIFFVLSGFLVTQILVRDLVSSGRVRLQQFYSRRARRILPAAVVTLVATALVYALVASPVEVLGAVGGFRAAFVYIANWYFIRQATDYFAANVNTNPVVHFWSLAVEEQFYLVWPMVLAGLFLITRDVGRWRWWVLRTIVAGCVVASAVGALHIATTNLDRAYYGTDTRAYQLLAGALLALTPQLLRTRARSGRTARWISALLLAAVLALGTSVIQLGPITRGVIVAVFVVVLLTSLENAHDGIVKRLLSSPPVTYLGRISYGVYLWHWPVIVIASYGRTLSPVELFVIATPTATALAALSFHLFEHPIRVSEVLDRLKSPIIVIGFATSVLFGIVVVPSILNARGDSTSALAGTGRSPSGLSLLDWKVAKTDFPHLPDCLGKPVQVCNLVHGTGERVVLMGDSNAWMWIPTFTQIAKERSWDLSVASFAACPWQRNLEIPGNNPAACKAHQNDWYGRLISQIDPELVILVHQAFDNPEYPLFFITNGPTVTPKEKAFEPALTSASAASLHSLQRPGRKIVILEPIPQAPPGKDPLACLSTGRSPAKCAFQANLTPTPLERFYRQEAAQHPDITSVDLDHMVCPRWSTCDAIVGDIIVRLNAGHVTATFAVSVASQMAARLPR